MNTAFLKLKPLEQYDISPTTGFLPSEPPLQRLSNVYFTPWENMMGNFNGLLLAGKLRERVHKMPLLDYKQLISVQEYRRAFLILCMISHGYVWGNFEKTRDRLPSNLAIPWTGIAEYLGLCPVVCQAAVVLWNYRLLDKDGPIDLSNIATLATYSGSLDEAWFYLVTASIESFGAPCLPQIANAINNINDGNYDRLVSNLDAICTSLENINVNLQRMNDKCDPYIFYWKIRPYLAGWENMAEAGLPHGLVYEGVDDHLNKDEAPHYRRYAGGSAAQSSLIAALDVAFGIEHHKTGEGPSFVKTGELPTNKTPTPYVRTNKNGFLVAMRKYMPKQHRQFLEDLEKASNIRPYMLQLFENYKNGDISKLEMEIIDSYNKCLHQLKLFRDKHVQIVSRYIVSQSRKNSNTASHVTKPSDYHSNKVHPETDREMLPQLGLAKTLASDAKVVRGTGGTNVLPFLKQTRDETNDMKIAIEKSSIDGARKKEGRKSWIDWALRR